MVLNLKCFHPVCFPLYLHHKISNLRTLSILFIFFLVVASIQVIYSILFLVALAKHKTQKMTTMPQPVSVIICAHDEEENLRELVPKLLEQDHPDFEVIIVNDRSNDGTYNFLLEETKRDSRLRMVNVDFLPAHADAKKYGITLAMRVAKHDVVAVTDADCRPASSAWIRIMSESLDQRKLFVLGYSPYFRESGFLNLFIRFETLLTAVQYLSFAVLGRPYMGVGRNMVYRKSFFLSVKGFNDLLSVTGGDDDLFVNRHANAANTVVCIEPDTLMYSKAKSTWQEFFKQKIRHLSVGKKYKASDRYLLGVFMFTYLATWICGLTLGISGIELIWVISALVLRTGLITATAYLFSKRVGQKFEVWSVPVLDFLFVIYYLSTGSVAFATKKVKWKN